MNLGAPITNLFSRIGAKKVKKDKNAEEAEGTDGATYATNFGQVFNRRGRSLSAAGKQEYATQAHMNIPMNGIHEHAPEREPDLSCEMKSESSHPSEVDYAPPPFSQTASICEMAITKRTILGVRRHVAEKYETKYSNDLPILVRTAFTASANAAANSFDNVEQDLNAVMRAAQNTMRRSQQMADLGDEVHGKAEDILQDTNSLKEDVNKLKTIPRSASVFVVMFLLWLLTLIANIVKISRAAARKVIGMSPEVDDDTSSTSE